MGSGREAQRWRQIARAARRVYVVGLSTIGASLEAHLPGLFPGLAAHVEFAPDQIFHAFGSPPAGGSRQRFFIFIFYSFVFYKNIFLFSKFIGIYLGRPAVGRQGLFCKNFA